MDLATLAPDVDPESQRALRAAGIATVADLARVADVEAVASATAYPPARVERLRQLGRDRVERALREAGVGDEALLAVADAQDVARRTGIARADVEWFQAAAREALREEPAAGVRVVLVEGGATARVLTPSSAREGVAIVTARASEDAVALLEAAAGDVVLLQEGAPVARARVAGIVHADVPIFRDDQGKLTRVRVAALRAREAPPLAKSLLARFRRNA